jgi:OOP family OmpA-OmpF porin
MNKIGKIALAMSLITGGTAFAQSESYNPSWYITPSVSVFKPDSDFGLDKNGAGIGLRWGKPLSQSWDLQFGPTFARSNDNGQRYEQATAGADFLYMFSRNSFRPFLLIGLGAERDKLSGNVNNLSKTSPYLNAGLGFQYAFNDQWSTQVDLRRVHGHIRDNSIGLSRINNDYLTAGLTYTFDKPAQQVAEVAPPPAVTPEPQPEPVAPAPPPRIERYTLSATELFEFNSAVLAPSQPKLDEIAAALNKDTTVDNVVVTGYTDRLGSDKYNNKLSLKRAEAVKNYLASQGVSSTRITAEGKGEQNPVVECKQTKKAALIKCLEPNRRVEVEQITIQRRVN